MKSLPRSCGTCRECCTHCSVEEIDKSVHVPCPHLSPKRGTRFSCTIYDDRPETCRVFRCGWLEGAGSNAFRPDRSGVMLMQTTFLHDDSPVALLVECRPNALLRSAEAREVYDIWSADPNAPCPIGTRRYGVKTGSKSYPTS